MRPRRAWAPVKRTRWLAMGSAVLLTSLGVGIIGPVSFVGLVAPHMARRLVGGHHQYLLPASMVLGALLLVLADTVGRTLDRPPARFRPGFSPR